MALDLYRQKRDFSKTAEPRGAARRRKEMGAFVVQKHDARRLHYDFRLEMGGVLKSWAVTRGPSLVAGEKRLAVHVEDHPVDYGDFEGTIPKGEYGGGTVIVWDRGRWTPVGDAKKGYAKGHLEFELEGEKLHGRWHLVRMQKKPGEKRENWLLIKSEDDAARPATAPDILEERPESVVTGRDVAEVAGEAPGWSSKTGRIADPAPLPSDPPAAEPAGRERKASVAQKSPAKAQAKAPAAGRAIPKGGKRASLPDFVPPALATLQSKPPAGAAWVHEIKFDGYRIQAHIEGGRVRLLTRTGLDWTDRFGTAVAEALAGLDVESALIDGEIVVETANGASEFSALQADLSEGRSDRFRYYAFDLLHLDGIDLTGVGLIERKSLLEGLIPAEGGVAYSAHFGNDGDLVLRHACRLSLEGVVSKRRDAPYRSGRGKTWVKSKCGHRQEFVVAGYLPSSTTATAIGSLVLGIYDEGRLVHVGRVGTGYTAAVARELHKRLSEIPAKKSPFAAGLTTDQARGVRFVRPDLVAEVEFAGWTGDGHLRHASFRGLREDKDPADVRREGEGQGGAQAVAKPAARSAVKLTHPDRVYWPDAGVTKQGLADYYSDVWRKIAPFVVARPLSMLRCPGGTTESCFFQKHLWKGANKAIRAVADPGDPSGEPIVVIDDLDGLVGLVQAGVLEIHPWGSTLADIERPDMIILDLDPGEGVSWDAVVAAAREVRTRLDDAGLTAFVKTTGGKGLHVVAPVKPKAEWPAVKAFCKAIADAMSADAPDRFVATVSKAKRQGRILVDYLRNGRGATAVAPYSTRARAGAPVSMPLAWEELGEVAPNYFTVANAPARLASLETDPWEGFREAAVALPAEKAKRQGRRSAR
ncbi:DNA ligase D [Pseudoxanthobacter sp. M-2]|uniref:DNA ligase D n=1 Tax=Pseudoxanthobacter sp. M-2 TaxID=3078754 RepID=UPI0038FC93BD